MKLTTSILSRAKWPVRGCAARLRGWAIGLGDFRVRSYEAVDKFMAVVLLALTYLQHRLIVDAPSTPRVRCLADVIRSHRDEHLCDWLSGACQEAVATGDANAVLQRYLRLNP